MGDPGAVVTVVGFALFVGADLFQCPLVGLGIALDGNLRRHAADRRAPRRWQVLIANSE